MACRIEVVAQVAADRTLVRNGLFEPGPEIVGRQTESCTDDRREVRARRSNPNLTNKRLNRENWPHCQTASPECRLESPLMMDSVNPHM
jgi:hypothetical protein